MANILVLARCQPVDLLAVVGIHTNVQNVKESLTPFVCFDENLCDENPATLKGRTSRVTKIV